MEKNTEKIEKIKMYVMAFEALCIFFIASIYLTASAVSATYALFWTVAFDELVAMDGGNLPAFAEAFGLGPVMTLSFLIKVALFASPISFLIGCLSIYIGKKLMEMAKAIERELE